MHTQWDDVDAHVIKRDVGTLLGYGLVGLVVVGGIWNMFQKHEKAPEEIRRPGDPIAWPWTPVKHC